MICRFKDEYRFLSNFYPAVIVYNGLTFQTVEHAYQAAKSEEPGWCQLIQRCETPGKAKRVGKKAVMRPGWDEVKVGLMLTFLRQKFSCERLRSLLLSTHGEELLEGNDWHDNYWGVCLCDSCSGHGRNMLGQLLMLVREEAQSV